MANYPTFKIFVRPGTRHKNFRDNEMLAIRSFDYGLIELMFWHGLFEIYYRPLSKRYGYFVVSFFDLGQALDFLKLPTIDLGRFLPGMKKYASKQSLSDDRSWAHKK